MHWPTVLKNLIRLALTAGVIVGIGAAFLLLQPASDGQGGLEVESSRADITWMTPFSPSPTQRFASALEDLGHEPPRAYDLNGNDVYFSTRVSRKSPERLLQEYQQAFVDHGVNSRMWMRSTDALSRLRESPELRKRFRKRAKAAIKGEILPAKVSDDYMSMNGMLFTGADEQEDPEDKLVGMVDKVENAADNFREAYEACGGDAKILAKVRAANKPKLPARVKKVGEAIGKRSACGGGGPKTCSDWRWRLQKARGDIDAYADAIKKQPEMIRCPELQRLESSNARTMGRDFAERIHGYRSIEAFRNKKSGQTVVTASWSDGDFDMTKVLPSEYGLPDQDDTPVPLCSSCKRAYSFVGSGGESGDSSNEIWSNESVDRVAADYVDTLVDEGWEFRDGAPVVQKLYQAMEMPDEGGRTMRFARGDRHLTLQFRTDRERGRTEVTAFTTH